MTSFGDMLEGSDAGDLVRAVRADRTARHAQKAPTFGENAADARELQAMEQADAAAAPPPPPQVSAKDIKFLVDTRTGELQPVLPGEPDPMPGPHDILMSAGDDPATPNILAQGKRVTPQALARLGDAKRGIQPALKKGYRPPVQYAGLADALGIKLDDGEEEAPVEEEAPPPKQERKAAASSAQLNRAAKSGNLDKLIEEME